MTLLQMIKKYEDAEAILKKQLPELPILASIGDVKEVLKDLKSVRDQQPSVSDIRNKVLEKINKEVDDNYAEGSRDWAQVLSMLPVENFPYAK